MDKREQWMIDLDIITDNKWIVQLLFDLPHSANLILFSH